MAPIASLFGVALTLSTQPTTQTPWSQQPIVTGSSTTQSTLVSGAGQGRTTSAIMATPIAIAAASTHLSSSMTAWSAAVQITNPSPAVRQENTVCGNGYVSCTNPGEIVCVGDAQYGLCATNNCARLQSIVPGVNCMTFDSSSPSTSEFSSLRAATPTVNTLTTRNFVPRAQAASSSSSVSMTTSIISSSSTSTSTHSSTSTSATTQSLTSLSTSTALRSSSSTSLSTSKAAQSSSSTATSSPSSSSTGTATLSSSSAPSATPSLSSATPGDATSSVEYTLYTGDGDNWPGMDEWVSSFDDMWDSNLHNLTEQVCGQYGPNSDAESATLKSAIQSAAADSKLDPRFILALVMQESHGCVRVEPTMGAHNNPGLLQDYDGPSNCNVDGKMKTPCPDDEITGMINDGVFGNTSPGNAKGEGLMQNYDVAGTKGPVSDAARYYITARIYNSGTFVDNDMGCGVATHCYSTDVANRLKGWTGAESPCSVDEVTAQCGKKPTFTYGLIKLFEEVFTPNHKDR